MIIVAWRAASFQKAKYGNVIAFPSFSGTASLSLQPPIVLNDGGIIYPPSLTGGALPAGHPIMGGGGGMGGHGHFGRGGFRK